MSGSKGKRLQQVWFGLSSPGTALPAAALCPGLRHAAGLFRHRQKITGCIMFSIIIMFKRKQGGSRPDAFFDSLCSLFGRRIQIRGIRICRRHNKIPRISKKTASSVSAFPFHFLKAKYPRRRALPVLRPYTEESRNIYSPQGKNDRASYFS